MRPAFRYEIQALRAVAVAAVVLYHLWPAQVRGGFVGVDVFFVISGFLITQNLAVEMDRTGRISLTHFWARRIRRILPAALAVLAASVLALVVFMPRVTWPNNLDEIKAAAAYFENWLLGLHAVDYLAAANTPSLVQHYWSLSVEEQFYLVWPLLLLGALLVCRVRRWTRTDHAVLGALGLVAVASFILSITWTAADPAMAFFATPTRAWEFAVGGIVGVLPGIGSGRHADRARAWSSWLGLGLIAVSVWFISNADPFPGWIAALPVAGTALVLTARIEGVRRSPDRLARLRPVQWLGDNSYSVYLWHWPLIVVAPWVLHRSTTWQTKLVILALTLALAAGTKRFVEDPIRTGRAWRVRLWRAYAFGLSGVTVLVAVTAMVNIDIRHVSRAAAETARKETQALLVSHHRSCFGAAAMLPVNHCARPYARPRHLDTAFAAEDGRRETYRCLQLVDAAVPTYCTFGQQVAPAYTVAVVGNSHARRLIPALDLYGRQHRWKIILASHINCMGLVTAPVGPQSPTSACLQWSAAVQQHLLAMPRLDAVIFASYRYAADYLAGLGHTPAEVTSAGQQVLASWQRLSAAGIRVIVTGDVPGMRPNSDPECIARSSVAYDPCAESRSAVVQPNLLSRLAQQHPALAHYISLTRYFCDATKCHALIGGVVVYFDDHHITTTYSRSLARFLGPEIAAAIAGRGT